MDGETLLQAMKLAGRPPSYARRDHDLGRFGLGLKTASLSQARSLIVATKQASELRAVRRIALGTCVGLRGVMDGSGIAAE
jgi:hypothetical protein